MRVRVTLTVEVDRDNWVEVYGTGATAADVRYDVRAYVREQVQGSAAADEACITRVTVGA